MSDQPRPFSKLAEELVGDLRHLGTPREPTHNLKGWRCRPKERATQPLEAVLEQLRQEYRIGRSGPEQTIRDHWREIVDPNGGTANASHSHAVAIERNQLIVLTSHPIIRNELFLHREEIVARIRKLPGCADVKSLYLRSG